MLLGQNSPMSFFEECLTLGQWLDQDLKRALYKYLLVKKKNLYKSDAEKLLVNRSLNSFVANGEIVYFIDKNVLKYKSRANSSDEYIDVLRDLKLGRSKSLNLLKYRNSLPNVKWMLFKTSLILVRIFKKKEIILTILTLSTI